MTFPSPKTGKTRVRCYQIPKTAPIWAQGA